MLFGLKKVIAIQSNGLVDLYKPEVSTNSIVYLIECPEAKAEREAKIEKAIESLVDEIIKRESGEIPTICNKEYGCRAGMGLMMFISSTWNSTLDRMKKEINKKGQLSFGLKMPDKCWQKIKLPASKERLESIFDGECNRIAGTWLLRMDGISHWEPYSGTYIPLIKKLGLICYKRPY